MPDHALSNLRQAEQQIEDFEAVVGRMQERIAELEAALRGLVAWEGPIELCAPELGGAMRAFYEARAVLEGK